MPLTCRIKKCTNSLRCKLYTVKVGNRWNLVGLMSNYCLGQPKVGISGCRGVKSVGFGAWQTITTTSVLVDVGVGGERWYAPGQPPTYLRRDRYRRAAERERARAPWPNQPRGTRGWTELRTQRAASESIKDAPALVFLSSEIDDSEDGRPELRARRFVLAINFKPPQLTVSRVLVRNTCRR